MGAATATHPSSRYCELAAETVEEMVQDIRREARLAG